MKLYDCVVRLDGSVLNTVPKTACTAAEIEVLRALHGKDAVQDIVEGNPKADKRTSAQERARLKRIYADPQSLSDVSAKKKEAMLVNLFGHDSLPLPDALVEQVEDEVDEVDVADEVVPVKRTVVAEPAFAE